MTKSNLLALILLLPFYVCTSQNVNKADYTIFEDKSIGWATRFPGSFKEMTADEINLLEGRGQEALEETTDEKLVATHKNLLWLKKDRFNSFTSNSQPFDSTIDGSFKDNQKMIYQVLEEAYRNQGIQFDTKYTTTKIDGLEFLTMETTLYTPDRKEIIMTQLMYDRLINGTSSLTLNINYNNDNDKAILLDIIHSSKLSIRN